ncbi:hypothetical protein Tco_0290541 [Tanacetum coccineum]
MGEGSAIPTDPHHTPTFIQPFTQPQKTQKPRKLKRKDTQLPQPSDPIESVAYEAVHKELGDSLVRATTTASSLEAEQDSGNINKTQSKATPNESSSQGTISVTPPAWTPRKLKERPTKPVVGIKASPGKLRQRRPKPVIMSPRKLRERPTKPVIGIKASPGKRRERRPKPQHVIKWCERFMNYLEEQTDGEAMIHSIKHDEHPLLVVAQVALAKTTSNVPPTLKDKSMWTA